MPDVNRLLGACPDPMTNENQILKLGVGYQGLPFLRLTRRPPDPLIQDPDPLIQVAKDYVLGRERLRESARAFIKDYVDRNGEVPFGDLSPDRFQNVYTEYEAASPQGDQVGFEEFRHVWHVHHSDNPSSSNPVNIAVDAMPTVTGPLQSGTLELSIPGPAASLSRGIENQTQNGVPSRKRDRNWDDYEEVDFNPGLMQRESDLVSQIGILVDQVDLMTEFMRRQAHKLHQVMDQVQRLVDHTFGSSSQRR